MRCLGLMLLGMSAALAAPLAANHPGRTADAGAVPMTEKEVRQRLQGRWNEWDGGMPRAGAEADTWWDFLNPDYIAPNLAVATYPSSESQQENLHPSPERRQAAHVARPVP
jgi:hypothetical protein